MHLIQLLLPISDNEGRPIDEDAFTMVRRELTEHFGGVTAFMRAPASGLWKRSPGDIEHDDLIMVEVVTDALDRGWWHDYRRLLEARFKQETIHVRAVGIERL